MHLQAIFMKNGSEECQEEAVIIGMRSAEELKEHSINACARRVTSKYSGYTLTKAILHATPEFLTSPIPSDWKPNEGCECGRCFDITSDVQELLDGMNKAFIDSIK